MSIFRPSTWTWNSRWPERRALAVAAWLCLAVPAWCQGPTGKWHQSPFLKEFFARGAVPQLLTTEVKIKTESGQLRAVLVRPDVSERLPAVLLAPSQSGLDDFSREAVKNFADIGFVALAVDYDPDRLAGKSTLLKDVAEEQLLGNLNAALQWLAAQQAVDAQRLGVVGFRESAPYALQLAARQQVRAAVVQTSCQAVANLLEKCQVPVLLVAGGKDAGGNPPAVADLKRRLEGGGLPHEVQVFPEVGGPFMMQPDLHEANETAAEVAWVSIYHFLGSHVEDAVTVTTKTGPHEQHVAKIVDVMRTINAVDGVRGQLGKNLQKPSDNVPWDLAGSQARLLTEAANLMLADRPAKGTLSAWRNQVEQYRKVARGVLTAVEAHDLDAARHQFGLLAESCGSCHSAFR